MRRFVTPVIGSRYSPHVQTEGAIALTSLQEQAWDSESERRGDADWLIWALGAPLRYATFEYHSGDKRAYIHLSYLRSIGAVVSKAAIWMVSSGRKERLEEFTRLVYLRIAELANVLDVDTFLHLRKALDTFETNVIAARVLSPVNKDASREIVETLVRNSSQSQWAVSALQRAQVAAMRVRAHASSRDSVQARKALLDLQNLFPNWPEMSELRDLVEAS